MKFVSSLFPPKPRHHKKAKLPVCQQDLIMFQALTGRSADMPDALPGEPASPSARNPIQTVARRWKPNVALLTCRLRTIYEHGAGPKRQQMTDWFKRISEQAANRLDEAHARLNAARVERAEKPQNGRVILTLHPAALTTRGENLAPGGDDYKQVA
jgi:hypothetical protein